MHGESKFFCRLNSAGQLELKETITIMHKRRAKWPLVNVRGVTLSCSLEKAPVFNGYPLTQAIGQAGCYQS